MHTRNKHQTYSAMAESLRHRNPSSTTPMKEQSWQDFSSSSRRQRLEQATTKAERQQVIQEEMDMDNSSKSSQSQQQQPQLSKVQKPEHPPGYNKKKRDIVKLILVVVAAALLRGDPKVATVLSIVSMICLKEGTFWSTKNLKWMALCIMSTTMGIASWNLEIESDEAEEEHIMSRDNMLYTSAKIIQLCWGMTLSVFLTSAYVHGHNSLLEFEWLNESPLPKNGPRKDPPPKTYLIY